ncbi:MAG: TetR family transcriptional regulator C-terminal domain-containing protein [Woeseiaceae bacterium]|nr:TetR family transcriptional regulator C-terminal domain-containing protein [Woeseiaceae bacterium]
MAANLDKLNRRALSKEVRRRELIDATIKCIARKGLGNTTLADVASEAGLSQGIVNLHFQSKDNLLAETLRSIADEYHEQFMETLDDSGPDPAMQLLALMEMDLKPSICDRKKLAVWFAFLGEVKAVPTYRKICSQRNQDYDRIMLELATAVIQNGGYEDINPRSVADVLSSLTDGMWLSCLMNPGSFDRQQALDTIRHYLQAVFPDRYNQGW